MRRGRIRAWARRRWSARSPDLRNGTATARVTAVARGDGGRRRSYVARERRRGEDGRVGAVEASRAGVSTVPVLGDSQRDDLVARLGEKVEDPLGFLGRDGEIAMDVDDGHRLALRRQLKYRIDPVLFAQRIDDGGVVACHADDPPLPRLGRESLGCCHRGVRSVELGDADVHDPGFRRRTRADAPINRKVLAIEFH